MRKIIIGLLALGVVVIGVGLWQCQAADEAAPPPASGETPPAAAGAAPATPAAPAGGQAAAPAAAGDVSPIDLVKSTPKGQLKNPYND